MTKSVKFRFTLVMQVCFLLTTWLSAQVLENSIPESVGISSDRLQRINTNWQAYIDNKDLAGADILIARKGKIVYHESFGYQDVENDIPMQQNSIFRIASQTKAIISVGVMILQEQGKLLIQEPVGNYIPAFGKTTVAVANDTEGYDVVAANRQITIRDLLTHTSGIGYGYGLAAAEWENAGIQGWYFADKNEPILPVVERMASLPFEAQPGEKFVYGYNTDILGALIEVVSGEPLDVFLQKHLLTPLGMEDTHFFLPQEKANRLTTVYSSSEDGIIKAPDPGDAGGQGAYLQGPRKCFSGGAGYLSTSMDYARFLQMLLNGGVYNENRILAPGTVELMTVNHLGEVRFPWMPGTGFGLGFSISMDIGSRGIPGSVGEYGWGGAYHSVYWVDPAEELVVVYFTQLIPSGDIRDHDKLRALVHQSIVE